MTAGEHLAFLSKMSGVTAGEMLASLLYPRNRIQRNIVTLFTLIKDGTTLIGMDPVRFFEFGTAPELETLPYVTWQEISGTPYNCIEGNPTTDDIKVQIDVWAETATDCRAVSREIRLAIDTHGNITFFSNSWDEASRLYRSILHYRYAKDI
jgi:hypothetical protein